MCVFVCVYACTFSMHVLKRCDRFAQGKANIEKITQENTPMTFRVKLSGNRTCSSSLLRPFSLKPRHSREYIIKVVLDQHNRKLCQTRVNEVQGDVYLMYINDAS